VMNQASDPAHRQEAMSYLAQLEMQSDSPLAALELYEKLLKEQARTPGARAQAHFEAARIAFDLKQWERARRHAKAGQLQTLASMLRYRCDMLAAECLFRLGKA